MERDFEARYQIGDIPWDHGQPDHNLIESISTFSIVPGKTLDIGCGTGENSIWLARQGFDVSGCDLSQTAIETAKQKARTAGVECCFHVADFLVDPLPDAPFSFVFDRGCLHSVPDLEGRERFVARAADLLNENGLWLCMAGNADEPEREIGPPRLTATELVALAEPRFEILSLKAGYFGSDQNEPPKAWIGMFRKR